MQIVGYRVGLGIACDVSPVCMVLVEVNSFSDEEESPTSRAVVAGYPDDP